ncbi:MAG: sporulation protein YunB, partial [Clostridia bacterium]
KIVSVNIKSPALNIYTAQLMNNITQKLKSCDTSEIGIPFGNITNTKLLSGIGPKIKIKIVPLGNISSDTKTSFDSAGINQTLLKINLKICCAFSVSTPFKQMTREMMFDYTICEMLIVGEIPQFYLHKLTDAPFQKQ